MPIEGSPKKLAEDISNGLVSFNKAVFRKYTPVDLKIIYSNLQSVLRETRAEFVDQKNFEEIKQKNIKMQKLNTAIMVLSNYCKVQRIPL